ncbi:MAG: cation transporter [Oscillospiraceae bacterium]|nr:cation transporter [Oscillospiraceae bacterium]
MNRDTLIIRTSIIGIAANVLLAAFKAVVGLVSGSIAVTLDAVNNLSDALSSVITIIGTKLAGRSPDKKHPYGHGRIEYISSAIIAVIVVYAGISSLVESVRKIITPQAPDYSAVSLVIVGAAVAVKVLLGLYVKHMGDRAHSDSLRASGKDALMDAIISFSVLVAAVIYLTAHVSLEAWLGAVISLLILKTGYELLRESASQILGERVDADVARGVKRTVCSFPEVRGAYDLVLHSYGPDRLMGSVHIEVPDTMTAPELDLLERQITDKVYAEHEVILTGISIYSMNTADDTAVALHEDIRRRVMAHSHVLQMHGFYLDGDTVRFDLVIDFEASDRRALHSQIVQEIENAHPDYQFLITLDADVSD